MFQKKVVVVIYVETTTILRNIWNAQFRILGTFRTFSNSRTTFLLHSAEGKGILLSCGLGAHEKFQNPLLSGSKVRASEERGKRNNAIKSVH